MQTVEASFTHLLDFGSVGLFELYRAKSDEAALAMVDLTDNAAKPLDGRVVWAGHVDQLFFGDVGPTPSQALLSTYPSKKQALDALAARREWGLDALADDLRTLAYHPTGGVTSLTMRAMFALTRLRGRRTPVADLSDPDSIDVTPAFEGDPTLGPDADAMRAYMTSGIEGKVIMFNLLRFRRDATGDSKAGRAAYGRYGRGTVPLIAGLGGRIRHSGNRPRLDGEAAGAGWDQLVCVEYPSRADFVGMVTSERYARGTADRDEGLEASALLVCTSHAKFF